MYNRLAQFEIDRWSPAPMLPQELVVVHRRPGVDGVGENLLGKADEPHEYELVSYHSTRGYAEQRYAQMLGLIGTPPRVVIYEALNYDSIHNVKYSVQRVERLGIQRVIRFISETRSLLYPTRLTLRVTMTAHTNIEP